MELDGDRVHEGYTYVTDKQKNNTIYLKCKDARLHHCKGRAKIEAGILQPMSAHNHAADDNAEIVAIFRHELKEACMIRFDKQKAIYDELRILHPEAAVILTYPSIESTMRRWRKTIQPPIPHSLQEYGEILNDPLWHRLSEYNRGRMQSATLSATDQSVSVIFGDVNFIRQISDSTEIFVDATYKVVPAINGAYQLLTVMATKYDHTLPFAWALMGRKSKSAYDCVLTYLRTVLAPDMSPVSFMTDFEQAMQSSLNEVYAEAVPHGCFFHYCQVCHVAVHAMDLCSSAFSEDEEGYGQRRICIKCKNQKNISDILPSREVENWGGLAQSEKNTSRPGRYLKGKYAEDEFILKENIRKIPFLKIGGDVTLKSVALGKENFTLENTCAFDSIFQIFLSAASDNSRFRNWIENHEREDDFFGMVLRVLEKGIQASSYRKRCKLLLPICQRSSEVDQSVHLKCEITIADLCRKLFKETPSFQDQFVCNRSRSSRSTNLGLVMITQSALLDSSYNTKIELELLLPKNQESERKCSTDGCTGTITKSMQAPGDFVIFEVVPADNIVENAPVMLQNIPKTLQLSFMKEQLMLAGVAQFKKPRTRTSGSDGLIKAIGHATAFCHRNGTWIEFDDTRESGKRQPKKREISLHLVIYAVYRKARSLHLAEYMANNLEAKTLLKKIMALALLPAEQIAEAFETVVNAASAEVRLTFAEFVAYYQRQWLRRVTPDLFSVYGLIHRTNNCVESYHKILLDKIAPHPNIWDFTHNQPDPEPRDVPLPNLPADAAAYDVLCCVCRDNQSTYLSIPCFHLVLCSLCANQILRTAWEYAGGNNPLFGNIRCPYCNLPATDFRRANMSQA